MQLYRIIVYCTVASYPLVQLISSLLCTFCYIFVLRYIAQFCYFLSYGLPSVGLLYSYARIVLLTTVLILLKDIVSSHLLFVPIGRL